MHHLHIIFLFLTSLPLCLFLSSLQTLHLFDFIILFLQSCTPNTLKSFMMLFLHFNLGLPKGTCGFLFSYSFDKTFVLGSLKMSCQLKSLCFYKLINSLFVLMKYSPVVSSTIRPYSILNILLSKRLNNSLFCFVMVQVS